MASSFPPVSPAFADAGVDDASGLSDATDDLYDDGTDIIDVPVLPKRSVPAPPLPSALRPRQESAVSDTLPESIEADELDVEELDADVVELEPEAYHARYSDDDLEVEDERQSLLSDELEPYDAGAGEQPNEAADDPPDTGPTEREPSREHADGVAVEPDESEDEPTHRLRVGEVARERAQATDSLAEELAPSFGSKPVSERPLRPSLADDLEPPQAFRTRTLKELVEAASEHAKTTPAPGRARASSSPPRPTGSQAEDRNRSARAPVRPSRAPVSISPRAPAVTSRSTVPRAKSASRAPQVAVESSAGSARKQASASRPSRKPEAQSKSMAENRPSRKPGTKSSGPVSQAPRLSSQAPSPASKRAMAASRAPKGSNRAPGPKTRSSGSSTGALVSPSSAPPSKASPARPSKASPARSDAAGASRSPSMPSMARAQSAPPSQPKISPGLLENVRGLEDLPEDAHVALAKSARVESLAVDEELHGFAVALVLEGQVKIMPAVADVASAEASQGEVVFTQGHVADGVALRVVASQDATQVAYWDTDTLEAQIANCPWVADDLRGIADRFQALAGAAMGSLGERLDDTLRSMVTSRCDVVLLEPDEVLLEAGATVNGMYVLGAGQIELRDGERVTAKLYPGDFLFPAQVMAGGGAPSAARAGRSGAVLLRAERMAAHELLVSVPPLIEILAG